MKKFRPLRHGERFVWTVFGLPPQKCICRTRPISPEKAIRESWTYASACTEAEEGVTWARGWYTKAASALRVAVAL